MIDSFWSFLRRHLDALLYGLIAALSAAQAHAGAIGISLAFLVALKAKRSKS